MPTTARVWVPTGQWTPLPVPPHMRGPQASSLIPGWSSLAQPLVPGEVTEPSQAAPATAVCRQSARLTQQFLPLLPRTRAHLLGQGQEQALLPCQLAQLCGLGGKGSSGNQEGVLNFHVALQLRILKGNQENENENPEVKGMPRHDGACGVTLEPQQGPGVQPWWCWWKTSMRERGVEPQGAAWAWLHGPGPVPPAHTGNLRAASGEQLLPAVSRPPPSSRATADTPVQEGASPGILRRLRP